MAPWLRPLHVTGLLLVLLAGPAPISYAVPHISSYEPAPGESRAGSRAGEGRERPGRSPAPTEEETQEEEAEEEAQYEAQEEDAGVGHPDGPADDEQSEGEQSEGAVAPETPGNTAPTSHPPVDAEQAAGRHVRASEPVLRVLPLGSGLVLIGLGLGLAFLALRVRRG
ncbi:MULTISPECIES: hypothetical protein [unclassified Streptomyces]|uniref:hypothetical protein n=1 Tax=unclassified Streptomyces TaxID=2593676 RepID=UPI003648E730